MSGSSGSGGQQSTTTVQQADPWVGQQPYLNTLFGRAQENLDAPGPSYFPGQVSAGPNLDTQVAQSAMDTVGVQNQWAVANQARDSNYFNQNNARDVNSNPYLQGAISAAIRPITEAYTRVGGTQNQIRDAASQAGQYGGTRHGVAEGIAQGDYVNKVGDVAMTMANRGYETGLDASTKANALAPQIQQMQTQPWVTLDTVGQQKQGYEQQLIDDAISKWNFEQNLPAAKLGQFQNLIQGSYGGTGTGTSTATGGTRPNRGLGLVGGAASGAAIGSMIPGVGTAVGAGVGALLSFL